MDKEIIRNEQRKRLSALEHTIAAKHGDGILIRANLAAINDMLIQRGKGDTLHDLMKQKVTRFEEKQNE